MTPETTAGTLMSREVPLGCGVAEVLRDPLIRLVMVSDGVSETELAALMDRVRRSLHGHAGCDEPAAQAGPRRAPLVARRQGGGREAFAAFPIPAQRVPAPMDQTTRRADRRPAGPHAAGRRRAFPPAP
jgi:hypothetical protein